MGTPQQQPSPVNAIDKQIQLSHVLIKESEYILKHLEHSIKQWVAFNNSAKEYLNSVRINNTNSAPAAQPQATYEIAGRKQVSKW